MTNQIESDYHTILGQISALTFNEKDIIANMANISAVLFNSLEEVNWSGFYLLKDDQLVLGPFQGQPACIRIPMGKGVCGSAAEARKTLVIEDVHQFEGHIACDSASNSEIVIPIIKNDQLIGVLDIDSPLFSRFSNNDAVNLNKVVDILVNGME
ncbi:GAF domain-containing protein [Glaciecola sp. 2405UD65-10]|uniref:GAF domain-containing protein n=1 Tax=Glaciecola sp. 2405UD65-10 TaxID=3397244 RepID=UPI003B5B14FE